MLFAFWESEDKDDEANDDEDDDDDQHNKIANDVKNGNMLLLTFEKLDGDNNYNYDGDGDGENHLSFEDFVEMVTSFWQL